MYLKKLSEEERKDFLDLAYYIAEVDDDFSIEEKNLIEEYKKETELFNYEPKKIEVKNAVNKFTNKDKLKRNIVFIEIFALTLADSNYCNEEKKLINIMQKEFNFSEEKKNKLCNWVREVISVYAQGQELLNY